MKQRPVTFVVNDRGCHICTSHKPMGKGHIRVGGVLLHRRVYEQHNGPVPYGLCVRHSCDTPSCINPAHLIVGTLADNNRDRWERGRSAVGENCGSSALTTEQVIEIRTDRSLSIRAAARKYGVGKSTIQQIRAGEIWKHLLPANDPRRSTPVSDLRKGVTKQRQIEIGRMAAAVRWGHSASLSHPGSERGGKR